MSAFIFDFPIGTAVRGCLLDSYNQFDLNQDILNITLPSGIIVDVGWYPACDPTGSFKIVVYRDYWRNHLCPVEKKTDPYEVASVVKRLVNKYALIGPPRTS